MLSHWQSHGRDHRDGDGRVQVGPLRWRYPGPATVSGALTTVMLPAGDAGRRGGPGCPGARLPHVRLYGSESESGGSRIIHDCHGMSENQVPSPSRRGAERAPGPPRPHHWQCEHPRAGPVTRGSLRSGHWRLADGGCYAGDSELSAAPRGVVLDMIDSYNDSWFPT